MKIKIADKKIFAKCIFEIFGKNINQNKLNGISFNSREIQEGDVFIAFKGNNNNGHNYVDECIKKGAILVINETFEGNNNIVKVKSSREALKILSKMYRSHMRCKVIAITGSCGKTTTKELLVHILKLKFSLSYTEHNFNSTIGMPMSTFSISSSDDLFIAEIGTNNKGEIRFLSEVAQPDFGVITNISESHLVNFHNMEGVYEEKKELFKSLKDSGTAFLNMDDPFISSTNLYNQCKVIKFGFSGDYDFSAKYESSKENIIINNTKIGIPDSLNIFPQNILVAFSISSELGIDGDYFNERLSSFKVPSGRGDIIYKDNYTVINDTYNSNFSSTIIGLEMLNRYGNKKRKIVVLGDMLELGKDEKEIHIKLSEHIIKNKIKHVFTFGTLMHNLYLSITKSNPDLFIKHYEEQTELINDIKKIIEENDIIYIKGSRSMQMEKIVQEIT